MDAMKEYLQRAKEIIGDRSQAEIVYDDEVLRGLRSGKDVAAAIIQANEKYPDEALQVDDSTIGDVASHYEFLLEHEDILKKMSTRVPRQKK